MTATNETDYVKDISPALGLKMVQVVSSAADQADYIQFTLSDYGLSKVWNIVVQWHDTTNQVIATEAFTSSLQNSGKDLRVAFGGAHSGKVRSVIVWGE